MNKKIFAVIIFFIVILMLFPFLNKKYRGRKHEPPPERPPTNKVKNIEVTDLKYRYGVDVGRTLVPNGRFRVHRLVGEQCVLHIMPVSSNSAGFRDEEWKDDGSRKMAFLGDEIIDGIDVPDGLTLARIVQTLTRTDVMNAGLRGYGTATQIVAYDEYVKRFRPKVTVLFFNVTNDVYENSFDMQNILFESIGEKNFFPCFRRSGNEIILKNGDRKTSFSGSDEKLQRMRGIIRDGRDPEGRIPLQMQIFMKPENRIWIDAWDYTEYAIKILNEKVQADGGRLVIVPMAPGRQRPFLTGRSAEKADRMNVRLNFDVDYPFLRLKKIADENGVFLYDPIEEIAGYVKTQRLPAPFIYYRFNGLLNPVGHFLYGNLTAKYILEKNLISLGDSEKTEILRKINGNLSLSPLRILGDESFNAIYDNRPSVPPFTGKTRIEERISDK